MSFWTMPRNAMNSAVVAPMMVTNASAMTENSISGLMRATMMMPAVTMVAAWISAEIGVGPSIESGSHTCSGTWALLPIAPMKRQMQIALMRAQCAPAHGSILAPARAGALSNTGA